MLKQNGAYLVTMPSHWRSPLTHAPKSSRKISHETWVFNASATDEFCSYYFCRTADLLALFCGSDAMRLKGSGAQKSGSHQRHLTMKRI
ncbi:MAG: hypothetical protein AAGA74_03795 [Pseudomonadota bacterium]